MKRYSILGVSLIDYTAREAVRKAESFLHSGALSTITYISATTLDQIAADETVRQQLMDADMTMCVEPDILEAAGVLGKGRETEILERSFLREFLKRIAHRKESVYLLGEDAETAIRLKETLESFEEELNIAGCASLEDFDRQQERMMNAVNEAAPKIIISRLHTPEDLRLMYEGRKLLNAALWMALPDKEFGSTGRVSFMERVRRKLFRRKVNAYNQEKIS